MIRLDYLQGIDIGRHRLVEKTVRGNVLGLWGVSGSGKTTVLQILEWLLSGKIDHPDAIAEFIRNNEHEDIKKMLGKGRFTVDGKPMEIERTQSRAGSATRELRWDKQDDKWLTVEKTAAGVEALLTSLIGANQKAISSIVFIRQGAFGKLFSGLDSDRRDFFVRLLMLGHLEKIAGVIDTYRKQMAASCNDLSGLRDQAEATYNKARSDFEEVEFGLTLLRDLTKEIEAGAELSQLWARLDSRESDLKSAGEALNAVLASYDLDRSGLDRWVADTNQELERLRTELKTHQNRLTSRNTYASNQSKLSAELVTIDAWMEKNEKLNSLDSEIAKVSAAAVRPDPRIRIKELDAWEQSYRQLESLEAQFLQMPDVDTTALQDLKTADETARQAASRAHADWQSAKKDLEDLTGLRDAAGHGAEESCRLCGNDHPDPKFIERAIENTQSLATRLAAESNELEARRRAASSALQAAENAATKLREQRNTIQVSIANEKAAVKDAPPVDSIVVERDRLYEGLPAWDAAKSMYDHLRSEHTAIKATMGQACYTQNERGAKQSELDMVSGILATLPPSDEIQKAIDDITAKGQELKARFDKVAAARDNHARGDEAFKTASAALQSRLETLRSERPFLVRSLEVLAPVITQRSLEQVLTEFRERQTSYDTQLGKVSAARQAMVNADQTLQELDVRLAEQKNSITIGKELENVRSAFIPSGITTEYLSHQFERIAVVTQDHLAQMSADFMVIASEKRSLSFDFMRLNEPGASWLGQNRMSGGQQVKLAIAVLLAIHELIIPQVGMLVLDEPSTHLDMDSRVALAEVLKEIGNRGNFQLIVCDHSPELRDAYTDTIELTEALDGDDEPSASKSKKSRKK